MYPCPCCGYETFDEHPGSYAICPICFWEDDIVQLAYPDCAGGANKCSLIEGQRNFAAFGACEKLLKPHVRAPKDSEKRSVAWRPINPQCDRYLKWESEDDNRLWQSVKNSEDRCLYYWLPNYWLTKQG
jgi:hypothetical protein